jgi:hypothetical protein
VSDKELADVICRALLAIVAGIRRKYGLPEYHHVTIQLTDTLAGMTGNGNAPNVSTTENKIVV